MLPLGQEHGRCGCGPRPGAAERVVKVMGQPGEGWSEWADGLLLLLGCSPNALLIRTKNDVVKTTWDLQSEALNCILAPAFTSLVNCKTGFLIYRVEFINPFTVLLLQQRGMTYEKCFVNCKTQDKGRALLLK